jgi:hypothetical protein
MATEIMAVADKKTTKEGNTYSLFMEIINNLPSLS